MDPAVIIIVDIISNSFGECFKGRILILDESPSGLDGQNYAPDRRKAESEVRSGRTILVITQDRELIESCCDNIVEVEKRSS